ncbi:MAG: hypothetical protein WB760_08235 [Xanthobacteraceae bacterium]
MFDEDTPIGRIAQYIARARAFYKQHCAPVVLRTRNFIRRKTEEYKKYREDQRQLAKEQAAREAEAARVRETEMATKSATAARAAYDPEAAIEDMRLAHSYLEDWVAKNGNHVLGLAAQYIQHARNKDPNAKLTVQKTKGENKGESVTYSLDELAATTLFYQSQLYSYTDAPPVNLQRARDLLKRAITYLPYSVQYRRHLAEVYLNLHDKPNALAVAEEAVSILPKDLDARKLRDFVRIAPETHAPTILETNPGFVFFSIGLVIFVIGIICLGNGIFGLAFALIVLALIAGGVGHFLKQDKMIQKAMDKNARDEANKR